MKSKIGQDRARQPGADTPSISKTLTVETGNRDNPDLKDSESRYRRLFESARHGILILDARAGTIEDVNPYLLGMLGYSRPELLGKRFWEVAAFKDVEADQGDFEALQANECIRRENLPLRAKGGHLIEVELVSCVYEENGRRVMQCEIRDVAGRVQNDGSLPPAEAELRALFASMRDVVLVIDRRGDYREIAPTHPGLLFKPPHELLGRNLRDTFSAELAQAFLGTIRQVLETGQTAQIEYELPIGGRLVWFAASVSRMDNDRTLWVARDVTESRQGEEALRAAHANYQSLFNNSTVGIYRSTPQGRIPRCKPGHGAHLRIRLG